MCQVSDYKVLAGVFEYEKKKSNDSAAGFCR